ncbi:DUF1206 domain-containing protein [Sphingomonas sp.]|jgi:hypothetical protein|uniref:DUF1206 domain-containing protein n=1 Tax=Sphingomonas sp. TaxID=28214 RepID=UPI002EDB3586
MLSDANATLLARLGFAARGLVYLLIGWFAIDAALRGGQTADNQGAIASLADEPYGPVLLGVMAAGLLGYAVWRLTEAAAAPQAAGKGAHGKGKGGMKRVAQAVSGITHLLLAWTAAKLAFRPAGGSGGSAPGDASARDWTALLLDQPLGRVLVGAVALGLLVAAVQQAKKAWTGDFVRELAGGVPLPGYVCTMGRLGYAARAVVFVILAGFFAVAAWQSQASEAGGMGAALGTLQAQPGGKWLLAAIGIGLALFGAYSFVEARFRRIHVDLPG